MTAPMQILPDHCPGVLATGGVVTHLGSRSCTDVMIDAPPVEDPSTGMSSKKMRFTQRCTSTLQV